MQETVFHDGEREMHRLLGVEDRLQELGSRMVRDHMPDQHREFFEMLPMVHLCALDDSGHPFPLVRTGAPGFMKTPDPRTLVIHSSRLSGEVETLQLSKGAKISVVGIEFETRRRNRMNATIASVTCDAITLTVDQSYGNCPKYIQARNIAKNEDIPPGSGSASGKLGCTR